MIIIDTQSLYGSLMTNEVYVAIELVGDFLEGHGDCSIFP